MTSLRPLPRKDFLATARSAGGAGVRHADQGLRYGPFVWDWIAKVAELHREARTFALVTVTACSGSTPCKVGTKMVVTADGALFGTIGGGHLESLARADADACMKSATSKTFRYPLGAKAGQCCGGVVETFVEVLGDAPRLYLFGAGHVGQAVARTLQGTAFAVHAIDEREEWRKVLPESATRHDEPWDAFVASARWDAERTYVAVMTHRHDLDEEIVFALLDRPTRYLGLIGSQTKWRRFRERMAARGASEEQLARVRCPIGLGSFGKAPQEVAVSVAAELLAMHYGR